jgi:hypothetical protein
MTGLHVDGLVSIAFNIFTDVAFATLPVPVIWTLKMPFRTRTYLIGVLSLGYVYAFPPFIPVHDLADTANAPARSPWAFSRLTIKSDLPMTRTRPCMNHNLARPPYSQGPVDSICSLATIMFNSGACKLPFQPLSRRSPAD